MSKLDSMFFDDPPAPSAISSPASPTPSTPTPLAPDLSQFFIFAPPTSSPAAPAPQVTAAASTIAAPSNFIPYGSYQDETWSDVIELDPADVTPCPKCSSLEKWLDVAGNEHCMRCHPLKIQRLRNWMNCREMLLNIHQMQREADEREQRVRAIAAADERDAGAPDWDVDDTAEA